MRAFNLKNLPVYRDIKQILDSPYENNKTQLTAVIATVDEDVEVFTVISLDIIRDYVNNISDTGFIEIKMALGDYVYRVYPNRDNLEISIYRTPLEAGADKLKTNESTLLYRYKAIPLKDNPNYVEDADLSQSDDSLILKDLVDVRFQILDRRIEPLRIKTIQGVYRNATVEDILHSSLVNSSNKITVDGKPLLAALDIVKPDNAKVYDNVIIPSGTHTIDLVEMLQTRIAGVYNAGIGTYLQNYYNNYTWYVYPLYKTDISNSESKIAIIYDIPREALPVVEKSFTVAERVIKILANQVTDYMDGGEVDMMKDGSGFRSPNAGSFMKKPVTVNKDGSITAVRNKLNYETVSKDRADGINYAPSAGRLTDNPYTEYSRVLARGMARTDLLWENGDPDIIYPGMRCKLMKSVGDRVVELNGTIVFVQSLTGTSSTNVKNIAYRTNVQLSLLIEPLSKQKNVNL